MTDHVAVQIPALNRETVISRAIQSCAQQTHRPITVCVLDDGSKDYTTSSAIHALSINNVHGSVKRIDHVGICAARQWLLDWVVRQYEIDWACWLDSDDEMAPTRIEEQLALAKSSGADSVVSWPSHSGMLIKPDVSRYSRDIASLRGNVACATGFFSARVAGQIRMPNVRLEYGGEDILWLHRAICAGARIACARRVIYYANADAPNRIGAIKRSAKRDALLDENTVKAQIAQENLNAPCLLAR